MPATRPNRIVRRAVMALAGVVLLPAGYVGSAMSLVIADSAGWLTPSIRNVGVAICAPLDWYIASGYPGADVLESGATIADQAGQRIRDL